MTLLRLGAFWVSSVGGSISGVKVRSIACAAFQPGSVKAHHTST